MHELNDRDFYTHSVKHHTSPNVWNFKNMRLLFMQVKSQTSHKFKSCKAELPESPHISLPKTKYLQSWEYRTGMPNDNTDARHESKEDQN